MGAFEGLHPLKLSAHALAVNGAVRLLWSASSAFACANGRYTGKTTDEAAAWAILNKP